MLTDLEPLPDRPAAGDPGHGVHHATMPNLKANGTQGIDPQAVPDHVWQNGAQQSGE
jgi:hypothetical protein